MSRSKLTHIYDYFELNLSRYLLIRFIFTLQEKCMNFSTKNSTDKEIIFSHVKQRHYACNDLLVLDVDSAVSGS